VGAWLRRIRGRGPHGGCCVTRKYGPWEVFPSEYDETLYVMPAGIWDGRGGDETCAIIPARASDRNGKARLIAAAPDLLEALLALFNHTGEYRQDSTADALWMRAYDAIAKATGEGE